jgi:hypothetical protein
MVRVLVFIGALLCLGVGALGIATMRSDIQIIIAVVGFASAFVLLAIGAVLGRLDKHWNFLVDIEERLNRPD